MLIKAVLFFLLFMAVMSMFGKWKFPGQKRLEAARCPHCKKLRIGKGPCPCRSVKKG